MKVQAPAPEGNVSSAVLQKVQQAPALFPGTRQAGIWVPLILYTANTNRVVLERYAICLTCLHP